MNIKGFGVHTMTPIESRAKSEATKSSIKSESSSDRDADGRRQNGDSDHEEGPTEEQIEKAIAYLETHPGVKGNDLSVRKVQSNGKILLLIEDHLGQTVRRIPESQIRTLAQTSVSESQSKGQLYHRAM